MNTVKEQKLMTKNLARKLSPIVVPPTEIETYMEGMWVGWGDEEWEMGLYNIKDYESMCNLQRFKYSSRYEDLPE